MRLLASVWFLLIACPAFAQHAEFSKKEGLFSVRDKANVYFFQSKDFGLVVRDEGNMSSPKYGSLDAAMRKSPCAAGVNGGFFSGGKDGRPLGLVVQDGKRINSLETGAFTVAGVVVDTGRDLLMLRSRAFRSMDSKPAIVAGIQGGPFLVEKGKTIPGLNAEKSSYRTFIATDGKGRWCMGVTSPMSLSELSQWLVTPGAFGQFRVSSALNLDGGSSSAFWCHESGTYFPSMKPVRNYVGAAPRAKGGAKAGK